MCVHLTRLLRHREETRLPLTTNLGHLGSSTRESIPGRAFAALGLFSWASGSCSNASVPF